MTYIYLATIVLTEVIKTSILKAPYEFTKTIPAIIIMGYGTAFYFMTLMLRIKPIGITIKAEVLRGRQL